jgi:flagellar M-ring protein FliF
MEFLTQAIEHVKRLWGRLSHMQQAGLVCVTVGAVVFAFLMLRLSGPQPYVVAFTNMDPKDAAASADALKAAGVAYQVTPDGTTIKVPQSSLADARLKLAAKGLPQGGSVGFELFDKTSFGVTDFVQNVNYQRALEGELQRTIDTLNQVAASKVNIVVPQAALFVSQQKPATASILLQFRPGQTLDAASLKGLSHLVARSVEGLDEKDITILDSSGKLLYDGNQADDTVAGLSTTQLELEQKVEQQKSADIQSMLDSVVGAGKSAVRVQADLDFSQTETTSQNFNPTDVNKGTGVVRSSQSTSETYNGPGQSGQQNGTTPNLPPGRTATPVPGQPYQYNKTDSTNNYEINSSTSKVTTGPGTVKRLSVSVLLDSTISDADAQGLQNAIAAAAGIDTKRGDQLVVTTATFAKQNLTLPTTKVSTLSGLSSYLTIAGLAVAALLVLIVVWRLSRSAQPKRAGDARVLAQPALTSGQAQAAYAWAAVPGGAEGALDGPPRGSALDEPSLEAQEAARRRQEITDRMSNLATANPDAIAEILHGWMATDRA